jgi:hypothetical protein
MFRVDSESRISFGLPIRDFVLPPAIATGLFAEASAPTI